MATLPPLQSLTSRAIDEACARVFADDRPRSVTLRCSGLGDECDRKLWYGLRWAHPEEQFEPRIRRIFANGNDREERLVEWLQAGGIVVRDRQARVTLANGALTGSVDGILENVPEAPKTPHLLEIKTMKASRYEAWRRKGVKCSDPKYYVQMQLYMLGLGLTRALFLVENQDTREIECQRVEYDAGFALVQEARAARIFASEVPPARLSDDPKWFKCRGCPAHAVCHENAWPARNCRTCYAASHLSAGEFHCGRTMAPLGYAEQAAGCGAHLYFPALVHGEVIAADHERARITYRMADGSEFVDGGQEA
jgi:hypothetical protein